MPGINPQGFAPLGPHPCARQNPGVCSPRRVPIPGSIWRLPWSCGDYSLLLLAAALLPAAAAERIAAAAAVLVLLLVARLLGCCSCSQELAQLEEEEQEAY